MDAFKFKLVTGVVGVALVLQAAAAEPDDREGIVCRWDFNGSLEDRTGSAANVLAAPGTRCRFVGKVDVPGVVDKAIALGVQSGDAEYLVAPVSDDTTLGPNYTIEAWICPTRLSTWNRLVLRWGKSPEYAYHLAIHQGKASLCHNQQSGEYLFVEGGHIEPGRWYHLAAVARRNHEQPENSKLRVYLNGRCVAEKPFDGTIRRVAGERLGIGDSAGAPVQSCRYRGYLDELTVWNRPLTGDEIAGHFAQRHEILQQLQQHRDAAEMAERRRVFERLRRHGVDEIVFAQRHPGRDPQGHYYANFGYSCCNPDQWLHGADGGRLCKLDLRTGRVTTLVDDPGGAVRDPQVDYDGRRILFAYRISGSHHYHLYEIHADGTGLRQLTGGPWDDVEPVFLPDDDILFCSTRCKRYIGCWLAPSATLHRCDSEGRNLRMLSSGAFSENTPAVLSDGRVLYTRWEYVNRDPVTFHHLWTVNPDGTGQMVYFGNMHQGGVFIDAQPIPGTDRVVLIDSPGHGRNEHAGYVATLTSRRGPDAKTAMKHISQLADYRDPFPVAADEFLVARGSQILLMDSEGETELVFSGGRMVHEPRPLVARTRAPILPSKLDRTKDSATLVLGDVYAGRQMRDVRRGAIKRLLVLEDLPKPVNYHGGGSQPIGHGVTSTLKRILGTVPVEEDGSAHFEVPPMRSVYFAALDEEGRSIKQMRSFVTLQPGEKLGCVGCHEPRTQTTRANRTPTLQALRRPASRIEPIAGVPDVFDFPRDVQPILDRHCAGCHNPDQREGNVVLSGDRGPVYSLSYYELRLFWQVKDTHGEPSHGSGRQPGNDPPYRTFSVASRLMKNIDGSHHDVKLNPSEQKIIRLWIDSGSQYPGTYAALGTGQVGGCWDSNRPVRVMADRWASTDAAVGAVARRCGACHSPKQLPYHVTARIPLDAWGDMLAWTRPLSRYSRHRIYNLSHPENSLILLAPLAEDAGGYATGTLSHGASNSKHLTEDRSRPPQPMKHPVVFSGTNDPDFQKILAHIQAAKAKLSDIKRFDMPGFRPNEHYIREMQRYGVLPASFDPDREAIDVYDVDAAYWRSFWHRRRANNGQ